MKEYTDQRSGVMYRKDGETVTLETKDFEGILDQLESLKTDKEYWKREAIQSAAELGEIKIKIAKAVDKLESVREVAVE